MSINQDRLAFLLERYAEKTATEGEVLEMFALIKATNQADDESIKTWLNEKLAASEPDENYNYERWNRVLANIISTPMVPSLPVTQNVEHKEDTMTGKVRRLPVWIRVSAAACIFLLMASGWYLLFNNPEKPKEILVAQSPDVKPPAINRATITLSDGQVVYLDSATNGTLAQQGNMNLKKLGDGQIAYASTASGTNAPQPSQNTIAYNTLTNPRGSKVIDITLSDGSRVWLNAASSVTFPVAFAENERKVTITGEAYFEVARNARKKFVVETRGIITEVLGTHFNVNSYADEVSAKITLLEGAVKVNKGNASSLLKPGQQAVVADKIQVLNDVNTEEVIAWQNGKFQFGEKTDIANVMRQIERWYDVEVEYKGTITGHIGGGISRDVNASKVLKMLEVTGVAKFTIEGKKVIISP